MIQDYLVRKFGVKSVLCEEISDFQAAQRTEELSVFYEFDTRRDDIKKVDKFVREVRNVGGKLGFKRVNFVLCGVLKKEMIRYVETHLSNVLVSEFGCY